MRAPEKVLTLKNGAVCVVLRSPDAGDAAQRIAFQRMVNAQTPFLARGTADSPGNEEIVAEMLEEQLEDDASMEISAFADGEMIATASIGPAARGYPRKRHRARIGVCVKRERWGVGVGSALLRMLISSAPEMGFSLIELSVVSDNVRAIGLYRKLGFVEAGRIPDALRYEDGRYADEILMVLNMNTPPESV